MINLEKYKMGRDKKFPKEWTKEVEENAKILISKVNALLKDLGHPDTEETSISSGWRPTGINSTTPNAATGSAHTIGKGVDIVDNANQDIGKSILKKPELLKKHGLWMEDLVSTKGKFTNWVHLDFKDRNDRPVRVFKVK